MPTGNSVEVRKDQHGHQHESVGGNADRVDLGDVESFLPLGIENRFLRTERIQVRQWVGLTPAHNSETHKEENEPAVRILTETPESETGDKCTISISLNPAIRQRLSRLTHKPTQRHK